MNNDKDNTLKQLKDMMDQIDALYKLQEHKAFLAGLVKGIEIIQEGPVPLTSDYIQKLWNEYHTIQSKSL